jgi:LmbE family N-acetylglucosaminyl deacetylase
MAVMAHPDDAEIYAGGTIARLVAEGKEVCIVKLTRGNKGSRQENITEQGLAALRTEEDKKGMAALGIKPENSIFLDLRDGEVENSLTTIEKIVKQIRLFKPELIITHNPEDSIITFDEENSWETIVTTDIQVNPLWMRAIPIVVTCFSFQSIFKIQIYHQLRC